MPASINDFMGGSGGGVGEGRAVGVIKLPMCLLTLPRRQQLWIDLRPWRPGNLCK